MSNAERFDTAAARAEMARIDAEWEALGRPCGLVFGSLGALLDRALAAIDAGWPEPAGDVVERAAVAAFDADSQQLAALHGREVGHYGDWNSTNEANRQSFRRCARAVLRSAGRMPEPADVRTVRGIIAHVRDVMAKEPDITPIGVIEEFEREANGIPLRGPAESRPFRPTAELRRGSVMIEACARANLTEEQTIEKLSEHATILERDMRRLLETSTPRISVPAFSPGDSCEERLTRYRCAVAAEGFRPASTYAKAAVEIEEMAHAMLAAERKVTP